MLYLLIPPYTSETVVKAHELAFEYMGGIPQEIVYDQDRLFLVSENLG
jgi:transposase